MRFGKESLPYKSEIRSTKHETNSKIETRNKAGTVPVHFFFSHLNLFRISCFVLRIFAKRFGVGVRGGGKPAGARGRRAWPGGVGSRRRRRAGGRFRGRR